MYEDPECFKNFASLQGKRPFTTFREVILENCFGFLTVYFPDFLDVFMSSVSKLIKICFNDTGVNYNLWMLGNSVA